MPTTLDIDHSDRPTDRRMYAHDLWPRQLIKRREREPTTSPARVWFPSTVAEVQALVRDANARGVPLVPYGAGSGVCAGIACEPTTWVVDLKRLDRVEWIDEARGVCRVGAGAIGERVERALNARGLSLGHFPSSIYCSTVGGWVACRSAGQLSSRYGKIEDIVTAVDGIDGRGRLIRAAIDDPSTGPAALRLLIGSEGAFCLFTHVEMRVHPIPSHRWLRGFSFKSLGGALEACRTLLQTGEAPSVLRLYDPLDSMLAGGTSPVEGEPDQILPGGIARAGLEHSGPEPGQEEPSLLDKALAEVERVALFSRPRAARRLLGELMGRPLLANSMLDRWSGASKLIVGVEGDPDELEGRARHLRARLEALGGLDCGDGPGSKWLLHRHRVSYRMARAFAAGGWVDTMEVSTSWGRAQELYHAVRSALSDVAIVMCHFSHAYVDGCTLYFTFVGGGATGTGPRSARARYDLAWERALSTVRRRGAAVSHHHGVGRSKAKAHVAAVPSGGIPSALKAALDPGWLLNPGVLGIGGEPAPSATAELDDERDEDALRHDHVLLVDAGSTVADATERAKRLGYRFPWRPSAAGSLTVGTLLSEVPPFVEGFVCRFEGATAEGAVVRTPRAPRSATGPDLIGAAMARPPLCRPLRVGVRVVPVETTMARHVHSTSARETALLVVEAMRAGRAFVVFASKTEVVLIESGHGRVSDPTSDDVDASSEGGGGRCLLPDDVDSVVAALDEGLWLLGAPSMGRLGAIGPGPRPAAPADDVSPAEQLATALVRAGSASNDDEVARAT